jgi:hypothetical protein
MDIQFAGTYPSHMILSTKNYIFDKDEIKSYPLTVFLAFLASSAAALNSFRPQA